MRRKEEKRAKNRSGDKREEEVIIGEERGKETPCPRKEGKKHLISNTDSNKKHNEKNIWRQALMVVK